jgi:hypothetical protein
MRDLHVLPIKTGAAIPRLQDGRGQLDVRSLLFFFTGLLMLAGSLPAAAQSRPGPELGVRSEQICPGWRLQDGACLRPGCRPGAFVFVPGEGACKRLPCADAIWVVGSDRAEPAVEVWRPNPGFPGNGGPAFYRDESGGERQDRGLLRLRVPFPVVSL